MKIIKITEELREIYKNTENKENAPNCNIIGNGWYCTREKGHKCKRHVAWGSKICFIWED